LFHHRPEIRPRARWHGLPPAPANDNRPERRVRRVDVLALGLLLTTTVSLGVAVAELSLVARFH
jgi:hypothetical protein